MPPAMKALIVDDDIWAVRLVEGMLNQCFPDLAVEGRNEPNTEGEFDIYFIDNDFNGTPLATELASRIRTAHPDALIIAFSGTLNADLLKDLINAGCNGACDKSTPSDLPRAMDITREYIDAAAEAHRQALESKSTGFFKVL